MSSDVPPSDMRYTRLGNSGLKVSRIILGCMSYGSSTFQSWVLDEEESMTHIKAAYDLGINAFDTADVYAHGASEIVLGKAIKKYNLPRDEIVVMTKFSATVNRDANAKGWLLGTPEKLDQMRYTNQRGGSRKYIFAAIKRSLERLQLDYVDVYQYHRLDKDTPIEETMQALHDIVKLGYARYIGMSSCYAWQFHKMQDYARTHGLTEFISMQNMHSAIYREEEREMAPLCQDLGVGMIPWSPLARGFLTRPISEQNTARASSDAFWSAWKRDPTQDAASIAINERIAEIAQKRGITMAQVALAWSLSKPFMTAPIVGTTSLDKLRELAAAVHITLTDDEVKAIDEPYEAKAPFGF